MDSIYSGSSKKQSNKEKTTNLIIDNELIYNNNNNNNKDDCILDSNSNNSCNIINKKKWLCSQCTYENWPSALKCTICLTSKSANAFNPSVNNQINSKLKPSPMGHNNNNLRGNKLNNNKKRNDSNNRNNIRSHESKVKLKFESNNNNNKSNEFINQSVGEHSLENNYYSSSSSNENLNENSTVHLSNLKAAKSKKKDALSNDIYKIGNKLSKNTNDILISKEEQLKSFTKNQDDSALNQSIETQKWSCQACTYLNWPKSIKCIQCYTLKTSTSLSTELAANSETHRTQIINPNPSIASLNNLPHFSESASIQTSSSSEQLMFTNPTLNDTESSTPTSSTNKPLTKITNTAITTLNTFNNESNSKNSTDIRSSCNSPCTVPKTTKSDQSN